MSFALTEINDLDIIEYDDMISEECNNYVEIEGIVIQKNSISERIRNILMINYLLYIYIRLNLTLNIFIPHECN